MSVLSLNAPSGIQPHFYRLRKYYCNSKGPCESALACRILASALSFLPMEDTANPIKHLVLPGQPGSAITRDRERERDPGCLCLPQGGRKGKKEGRKCTPCSEVTAAVWQCHRDEGVCLHRKGLWRGGSWDKASCSSLEWGKTWLGLCRGRNLKIQAEWHSCWLILRADRKVIRGHCSCSKASTHPQLQCCDCL